jgi:hypothetical protein
MSERTAISSRRPVSGRAVAGRYIPLAQNPFRYGLGKVNRDNLAIRDPGYLVVQLKGALFAKPCNALSWSTMRCSLIHSKRITAWASGNKGLRYFLPRMTYSTPTTALLPGLLIPATS